jgi:hypothetical protein
MVRLVDLCAVAIFSLGLTTAAPASEKRCGWYENPSPANLSLQDKEANWNITSMGEAAGPNAADSDKAPDFNERQFVHQGPHGYGCACLVVDTDKKSERITRVYSGTVLPISKCRADKSLPPPD